MLSLPERQAQRALRKIAGAKGEDISHLLETSELKDAKETVVKERLAASDDTFVPPQFAISPIKNPEVAGAFPKTVTVADIDGTITTVDGDPANKKESSEKVNKASSATKSEADRIAKAANQQMGWTANTAVANTEAKAGNGGTPKEKP